MFWRFGVLFVFYYNSFSFSHLFILILLLLFSVLFGLLFLALFLPLLLAPNSAEILCPGDRTGNAVSGQEYAQGCRFCCPSQWSKLFCARLCSVECSAVFIIQVWTDTKTCQWESLQTPSCPPRSIWRGVYSTVGMFLVLLLFLGMSFGLGVLIFLTHPSYLCQRQFENRALTPPFFFSYKSKLSLAFQHSSGMLLFPLPFWLVLFCREVPVSFSVVSLLLQLGSWVFSKYLGMFILVQMNAKVKKKWHNVNIPAHLCNFNQSHTVT